MVILDVIMQGERLAAITIIEHNCSAIGKKAEKIKKIENLIKCPKMLTMVFFFYDILCHVVFFGRTILIVKIIY